MKSAVIVIICLLGLTACESTGPATSGAGGPAVFKGDLNNLGASNVSAPNS